MNTRKIILLLIVVLCYVIVMSHNTMKVHYKDGTKQDIFLSEIDSVTFMEQDHECIQSDCRIVII